MEGQGPCWGVRSLLFKAKVSPGLRRRRVFEGCVGGKVASLCDGARWAVLPNVREHSADG